MTWTKRNPAVAGGRDSEKFAASNWFPGCSDDLPRSYRQAEAPCSRTLCPGGERASEIAADVRFRRQVERFHACGSRFLTELLAEIDAERSIQTIIEQKLATYLSVSDEALDMTGGWHFPPIPIHEVRR